MRVRTDSHDQHEPRVIGGYRVLRCLARGGMSSVYLTFDQHTLTPAAVKVPARYTANRSAVLARFRRESRIGRTLAHPNLVRGITDGFDPQEKTYYLAMEYVDGSNVRAMIARNGPLPLRVAVAVAADTCRALAYLHDRDYVHRDVKPDNVLVDRTGRARLADLGLAKRLTGDDALTADNQLIGTPAYMPPEQIANAGLADVRSDLYALGGTLFHMVTGREPFHETGYAEMTAERNNPVPPSILDDRPTADPALDRIIADCLAPRPADRIASAAELEARLSALRLDRPPADWWSHLTGTGPTEGDDPPDRPTRIWHPSGNAAGPLIAHEPR